MEVAKASDPRLLKPRTIRLHHRRGVKVLSPNGLPVKCVDRTSRWGNPFEIGRDGTREQVIQKYRDWFLTGTELKKVGRYIVNPRRLRDRLDELRGFNLACCRPELPCHADFLLEQASQPEQTLQAPQNLTTEGSSKRWKVPQAIAGLTDHLIPFH
jgi:hypothetical protein